MGIYQERWAYASSGEGNYFFLDVFMKIMTLNYCITFPNRHHSPFFWWKKMGEILQVEWWQLLCIIETTSGGKGNTFERYWVIRPLLQTRYPPYLEDHPRTCQWFLIIPPFFDIKKAHRIFQIKDGTYLDVHGS